MDYQRMNYDGCIVESSSKGSNSLSSLLSKSKHSCVKLSSFCTKMPLKYLCACLFQ